MARRRTESVEGEGGAISLATLRDVLRRRGSWGLLTFLVVLAPLASLVYFLPDVYVSAATVLIERQQIPDELVRSTVTSALEVRLQTISQEILSRSRLEEVIARFGLYQDLKKQAPMETVIEQMRKDARIDTKGRGGAATIAFAVSYRGRDAQKVALVANSLAAAYIEENLKMRERQASGTADFMRVQLEDLARKLGDLERKVGEFKARHIGELPEQLDANLKGLEQLSTQLRLNAENMTRATERRGNLERELSAVLGTSTTTGPDAGAIRLAQLRGALLTMQTRYSDKHPEVQRLKADIATLEAAMSGGGGEGAMGPLLLTPQTQSLKNALLEADVLIKGLEMEAGNLKRQLSIYQARVESVPRVQQDYQAMSREYETTQEMYKSLTVRQRESALAERMEQRQKGEQFRVIEPALPSETPAAPKRPLLFGLVLILALAAGAAAIFGPEVLDSSVHTVEQLQARCDLPVLVTIPRIVGPDDIRRRRRRLLILSAGVSVGVAGLVVGSYLLAKENWALTSLLIR